MIKTPSFIVTWDLGATKCAAALMQWQPQTEQFTCLKHCHIKLTAVNNLEQLVALIEQTLEFSLRNATAICIGAAGMFDGEEVQLQAGYPYPMKIGKFARENQWPPYQIIHDYAPIICGTFIAELENPNHIQVLHPASLALHGRRVTLGVGTGLGVKDGGLLPEGNFWLGANEMGHIGISQPVATTSIYQQRHQELLRFLTQSSSHLPLSFETILSGKGTLRLHEFLHPSTQLKTPEEVGAHMRTMHGQDTLALFAWYLGLFISTVQLTFMPDGGIWMTGGVLQQHSDVFQLPEFWQGIAACPAYQRQRQTFPLYLLRDPLHAFKGAAWYAAKRLLS